MLVELDRPSSLKRSQSYIKYSPSFPGTPNPCINDVIPCVLLCARGHERPLQGSESSEQKGLKWQLKKTIFWA